MNCKKCGFQLNPEDRFCKNCGAPVDIQNAQSTINSTSNVQNVQPSNVATNNYNNMPQPSNTMNSGYITQPSNNLNNSNTIQQNSFSNNGYPNNTTSYSNGGYNMPRQQGNPYQTSQNSNSKGNSAIIIVGISAIVAIVTLVIILVPKLINKSGEKSNSSNSTSVQNTTSSYKVNYGGFTFIIPDNMQYEVSNDGLLISDEYETWVAYLEIIDRGYNDIKTNKSKIQGSLNQQGYNTKSPDVKTIGGNEYITLEASYGGQNAIIALGKLNSMKTACLSLSNQDNTYNYDILKQISPIISTATYNANYNGIKSEFNFNFDIDEILNAE